MSGYELTNKNRAVFGFTTGRIIMGQHTDFISKCGKPNHKRASPMTYQKCVLQITSPIQAIHCLREVSAKISVLSVLSGAQSGAGCRYFLGEFPESKTVALTPSKYRSRSNTILSAILNFTIRIIWRR